MDNVTSGMKGVALLAVGCGYHTRSQCPQRGRHAALGRFGRQISHWRRLPERVERWDCRWKSLLDLFVSGLDRSSLRRGSSVIQVSRRVTSTETADSTSRDRVRGVLRNRRPRSRAETFRIPANSLCSGLGSMGRLRLVVVGGRGAEDVWPEQMPGDARGCLHRQHMARGHRSTSADPLVHGLRGYAQKASDAGLAGSQLLDGSGDSVHAAILSIALVQGQAMLSYIRFSASTQSSDA